MVDSHQPFARKPKTLKDPLDLAACRNRNPHDGGGAGVSNLANGLGLTDHDREMHWRLATLERDVLLEFEAKLLVVGVIGRGARFEVDGAALSIGLFSSSS